MKTNSGLRISIATALCAPVEVALPAVETILKEMARQPGNASLALNIRELRVPLEAMISVPIEARVHCGEGRNQWLLRVRAARRAHMYPVFEGTLTLLSAAESGSQLQLDGTYVPPFGSAGRAIDATVLRGAAQSSLHSFLRNVASRVAMLARWAQLV